MRAGTAPAACDAFPVAEFAGGDRDAPARAFRPNGRGGSPPPAARIVAEQHEGGRWNGDPRRFDPRP